MSGQVPPNKVLHLQATPIAILAKARMPLYAVFQVSLDVRPLRMRRTELLSIILLLGLIAASGCTGITTKVERKTESLPGDLESLSFDLAVKDGSEGKPNNWDGNLNLLWTNDKKRAEVLAEHIEVLVRRLREEGFDFLEDENADVVRATLQVNSVRRDPINGWTTDGATLTFSSGSTGEVFGVVDAVEDWVTPKIGKVFESLVQGSVELWASKPDE